MPRLGGHWGACDPDNPKNRRQRCSILVEQDGPNGTTRVLVDASPDMRNQLLNANVGTLDGVVFTHPHADHTHGLDDLRMIVINTRERLPVWADAATRADLEHRFSYAFTQPEWSSYPPILQMNQIDGSFTVPGPGGEIDFTPFTVPHGGIHALGFRIGAAVYLPDVATLPDDAWPHVQGLDLWIVDALRYTPHPSHSHLDQTLGWIERVKPRRSVITNMHVDLDFATLAKDLPEGVEPAYDGLVIPL